MRDEHLMFLRTILHLLDLTANGQRRQAEEWFQMMVGTYPDLLSSNIYCRLLARDLGLWPGPGMDTPVGTGFYRQTATCQIPCLAEIYEGFFGQTSRGFFVEAGGYDGDTYSNTSFLADLGWEGIYVEPVREYCEISRHRHRSNRVKHFEVALSDRHELLTLQIASMSTSAMPEMVRALAEMEYVRGWLTDKKRQVMAVPLNFLLTEAEAPSDFDLLVLDLEGGELKALQGLDLSRWRPKMIIAELLDQHPDFGRNSFLHEVGVRCRDLLAAHYDLFYQDEGNSVFVAR